MTLLGPAWERPRHAVGSLRLVLLLFGLSLCLAASWCLAGQDIRSGLALWGVGALFIVSAAFRLRWTGQSAPVSRVEVAIVVLLLLTAATGRFYKVTSLPGGLYSDEVLIGLDGIDMMKGAAGKLFTVGHIEVPKLYSAGVALILKLFGISVLTVKLPALIGAMVGLVTTYLLARTLLGPYPALTALTLMVAARWHLNMSRWGHGQAWVIPSLTLTAWLTLKLLRNGRYGTATLAGLALALSQYNYQASRIAVPLTAVVTAIVGFHHPRLLRRRLKQLSLAAVLAITCVAPLVAYYVRHPETYLFRARQISLVHNRGDKSLSEALRQNASRYLQAFHVRGDFHQRNNFAQRPMLDWVTGGLGLAGAALMLVFLRRWQVQVVWAFLVMILTSGLLTTEAPSTFRTMSLLVPFCLAAALPALVVHVALAPFPRLQSWIIGIAVAGLACTIVPLNYRTYFEQQVFDRDYWWGFAPQVTMVASEARSLADANDVYYSTDFSEAPTFMVFSHGKENIRPFAYLPIPLPYHPGRGATLFAPSESTLEPARRLYPGALLDTLTNPFGESIYSRLRIDAQTLRDSYGLWLESPTGRTPVPSLAFPSDAPRTAGEWAGSLNVPAAGQYRFTVAEAAPWTLEIGGERLTGDAPGHRALFLPSGLVSVRLRVESPGGGPRVPVLWAREDGQFEPVPDAAWSRLLTTDSGVVAEDYPLTGEATDPLLVRRAFSFQPENALQQPEWKTVFSARLRPPATGDYALRVKADSGAYLYVDGEPVTPLWPQSPPLHWDAATAYQVVLMYPHRAVFWHLDVAWKTPTSAAFTPIPPEALSVDWEYVGEAAWRGPTWSRRRAAAVPTTR